MFIRDLKETWGEDSAELFRETHNLYLCSNTSNQINTDQRGFLKSSTLGIPGSPVVRTQCFHCRGHRFHLLVQELRSHMPQCDQNARVLSCGQLFATPWTVACQATLSMNSRQEYWRRLPFPTPGDLPNPGIEPMSFASPAVTSRFFTTAPPGKPLNK